MTSTQTEPPASYALESAACIRELRVRSDGVATLLVRMGDELFEVHCGSGEAREVLSDEVDAAGRAQHPHLCPVIDCWSEGERLVLLRPQCGRTLEDVLRAHPRIPPGVAVTVLAPLAAAIGACHANGVVGIPLQPCDVAITDNGTPRLRAYGIRVETRSVTPHWLADSAAAAADASAFIGLAESLLSTPAPDLLVAAERRDWSKVSATLMQIAPPVPVASLREPSDAHDAKHLRAKEGRMREVMTRRMLRRDERKGLVSNAARGLGIILDQSSSIARSVRPRFWILGGVAAVAVLSAVIAVAAIPVGGDELAVEAVAVEPVSVTADAGEEDRAEGSPDETTAEASPSATQLPQASPSPAPAFDSDEPLEAVSALLLERERCLDEGADECLRGILMPGSLLYADDLSGEPQWRFVQGSELEMQQQLGDAVIVSVVHEEQPASVLAVSTEARWLLREVWVD